jgi:hypothetical protein
MNCPQCEAESKVINSRNENGFVKRRRICEQCNTRWSTYEIPVELCEAIINRTKPVSHTCSECNKLAITWKYCKEHLNEYKKLDMRKRRAHYQKTGIDFPKLKRGPKVYG